MGFSALYLDRKAHLGGLGALEGALALVRQNGEGLLVKGEELSLLSLLRADGRVEIPPHLLVQPP